LGDKGVGAKKGGEITGEGLWGKKPVVMESISAEGCHWKQSTITSTIKTPGLLLVDRRCKVIRGSEIGGKKNLTSYHQGKRGRSNGAFTLKTALNEDIEPQRTRKKKKKKTISWGDVKRTGGKGDGGGVRTV